jgi:hypothetical protein
MSDPSVRATIEAFFALKLDDPEVMAELDRIPVRPFLDGVTVGSAMGRRLAAAPTMPAVEDKDPLGVEEQMEKATEALDYILTIVERAGPNELPAAHRARLVKQVERLLVQGVAPDPGTPEALACLDWSRHDRPGERVMILAAQGFAGCGRHDAEKMAMRLSQDCTTDAEAVRLLRGGAFRSNELADLPFPIRNLLGFNEHGQVVDRHGMAIDEVG